MPHQALDAPAWDAIAGGLYLQLLHVMLLAAVTTCH
jgi:hypothetical protein